MTPLVVVNCICASVVAGIGLPEVPPRRFATEIAPEQLRVKLPAAVGSFHVPVPEIPARATVVAS